MSIALLRQKTSRLVESNGFSYFITVLILLNAITLGLETNADLASQGGDFLAAADQVFLGVFTLELLLKLFAHRGGFFRNGWNLFDLVIVTVAWIPSSGPFSVLRALRILRILRLISVVPQMRRVVGAVMHSIPGMLSVVGVLGIIFYVAAVLATKLFGQHPDPNMQDWFGSISASAYTLFQIMTLESWSMGIVRPTMALFPEAWIFFIPFIIITSFAVLNLFIGIIVDAMQTIHEKDEQLQTPMATREDIRLLMAQIDKLEEKLDRHSSQSGRP